jgi:hypothetical protein
MIAENNYLDSSTGNTVEQALTFNGKSASANALDNPPKYIRFNLGDTDDTIGNPDPDAQIASAIAGIYQFKPHIVIHAYPPSGIAKTFFPLVLGWPRGPGAPPVPYHIDAIGTFPALSAMNQIIDLTGIHGRVLTHGTHVADRAPIGDFVVKFRSAFPQLLNSPFPELPLLHSWYDATYMAAYAIAANGNKPVTGTNLAVTLPKFLPPGTTVHTGSTDIPNALGLLQSGGSIDLEGLSGNLNLDPKNGSPNYDLDELCPDVDPTTKTMKGWRPAGFSTTNGVGAGSVNCQ